MLLSLERSTRGEPSAWSVRGPRSRAVAGLVRESRRGRRTRHTHSRVLQELGTPCGSISTCWRGLPDRKAPGPRSASDLDGDTNTGARDGIAKRSTNEARREGPQGIGTPHSTAEVGEPVPRGPGGGKEVSGCGTVGGKHGRCSATGSRVHEMPADSRAGAAATTVGVHVAQPPPGPDLAGHSLQPNPQRRGTGRGRTDGRRLRADPVGQPGVASGPC